MKQEKIKNKALKQAEVLYDTEKEKFADNSDFPLHI